MVVDGNCGSVRRHRCQIPDAGQDPGGFIITALLGVAGMFVGGWLSHLMFGTTAPGGQVEPAGFIGGVIGALILLALYRMFKRNA